MFSNTQNVTEIPLASGTTKSTLIKTPSAESDIYEQMSSTSNSSTSESSSSSISQTSQTMTGGESSGELTLSTLSEASLSPSITNIKTQSTILKNLKKKVISRESF